MRHIIIEIPILVKVETTQFNNISQVAMFVYDCINNYNDSQYQTKIELNGNIKVIQNTETNNPNISQS